MAIDLRATKVTENINGTYLVAYEVFDTTDPQRTLTVVRVQGSNRQEIASELVRKYTLWKNRNDRQTQLLTVADAAAADAKAIIAQGG